MSIRYLILILVLAFAVIVRAADKPPMSPEPDHLVPINPYPGDWRVRYSNQLRSRLNLDPSYFAQMVVLPSFSGEYAVRLHSAKGNMPFELTNAFFLTYSAADKSIWYSMPGNSDKEEQQTVSIAVSTVEISKPLATRIRRLWQRMLLRTRYPEKSGVGLDGVTYEFSIWCVYGQTWSPEERKSPLLFVELGESLVTYCKAAPAERPAAAKQIENKAEQLEKYLNEHPSK